MINPLNTVSPTYTDLGTDSPVSADASALTGESVPKSVYVGETVLSGFINKNKPFLVQVEKSYENSTISKLCIISREFGNEIFSWCFFAAGIFY